MANTKRPMYKFVEKMNLPDLENVVNVFVQEGYDLISFEISGSFRSYVAVLRDTTEDFEIMNRKSA